MVNCEPYLSNEISTYVDEEGDVIVEAAEEVPDTPQRLALHQLEMDHPSYAPGGSGPAEADDPHPGPSVSLKDRHRFYKEALDAAADARKAEGRAKNVYNRGQIARHMDISNAEVNANGEAMAPVHAARLNRAFTKLMGYETMRAAGMDTTGLGTSSDFVRAHFGTKEADRKRADVRKVIKRQT